MDFVREENTGDDIFLAHIQKCYSKIDSDKSPDAFPGM